MHDKDSILQNTHYERLCTDCVESKEAFLEEQLMLIFTVQKQLPLLLETTGRKTIARSWFQTLSQKRKVN